MLTVVIRVSIEGEFENSYTEYMDEHLTHDEIMEDAKHFLESRYGNDEAWDEGEVSWTVDYEKQY